MTQPDRPEQVDQLDGSKYAGLNCTCAAGAMAVDRSTLGTRRTTGAAVRALTGDTSGGTRLTQVAAAVKRGWDVQLDVRLGIPFLTLEQRLHAGQGAVIQGRESVFKGTRFQSSETFGGNHAMWVNEGRGWKQRADGLWIADEYLCYNPLADGRRPGIAQSPYWVPKSLLMEWCGKLDVSSNPPATAYRALGIGKVYAAFSRDTEPHAHLRYGGRQTKPFPDDTTAWNASAKRRIRVRAAPTTSAAVVAKLKVGDPFEAWQVTDSGSSLAGSKRWYGNHDGNRWVHSSGLRGKGGTS